MLVYRKFISIVKVCSLRIAVYFTIVFLDVQAMLRFPRPVIWRLTLTTPAAANQSATTILSLARPMSLSPLSLPL